MANTKHDTRVRAVECNHTSTDEQVYEALARAVEPLDRAWQRLGSARRIGIKFNQDMPPERVIVHRGRRQQLVSDAVVRATIRLLRERTSAELFAVDVGVERVHPEHTRRDNTTILPVLDEPVRSNSWIDEEIEADRPAYYRIAARDASSNQSPLSPVVASMTRERVPTAAAVLETPAR